MNPPLPELTTAERIDGLYARRDEVERIAEKRAADRQHTRGKLTARERVDLLLDPGSFVELDQLARHRCTDYGLADERPYGDGVVTGHGTVNGRTVAVFSQDFSTFGGSMGEVNGSKVIKVMDLAIRLGCPIVGINDSGGARIQEGVVSLAHYAELARRNVAASGLVPQISMILGPCAGGAVYTPAITDFTVMAESAHMFVTGPDVVRAVTGETVGIDELGGAGVQTAVSGAAHHSAADEEAAVAWVQDLLAYLPSNNMEPAPQYAAPAGSADADLELDSIVPDAPNQTYDMRDVLRRVVDDGDLLEVHEAFAPNVICGFARVEGASVGVVANQPLVSAGVLDGDASEKAARFVRFCDAFGLPILTFVDVPGYLPGVAQERGGIIRRGAKLPYAYAEATVPMVTVVTRKAFGGGYAVMGSKHLGADVNLAWPTAEIAVMGAEGAVEVLHRRELAALPQAERGPAREEFLRVYREQHGGPYTAADRGYVDAVIAPSQTRTTVARALRTLRTKRVPVPAKKHGNIPL